MPNPQNPTISGGTLPQSIPSQTVPFGRVNQYGEVTIDVNWYLFLYNVGHQTISPPSAPIPATPVDFLAFSESDVASVDAVQDRRTVTNVAILDAQNAELANVDTLADRTRINNVQLLQVEPDAAPTFRDYANAMLAGSDAILQDPVPQAQPAQTVTVTASPFTYTAPRNGAISVTGGTVSAIAIIRQGVTVATGMIAGLFQLSRLDQVQVTYTVAPTMIFLPS